MTAKWSNSAKFIPQSSVGATDYLMGITGGGINAKYLSTLFVKNLASSAGIYVSKLGNDTTGNGSFYSPYLTIQKANSVAVSGTSIIYIDAGTYAEADFTIVASVSWIGSGISETFITMANMLLNTASWAAATNPFVNFSNLKLTNSVRFVLQPSALQSNSDFIFSNVFITSPSIIMALVTNLVINPGSVMANPFFNDVQNGFINAQMRDYAKSDASNFMTIQDVNSAVVTGQIWTIRGIEYAQSSVTSNNGVVAFTTDWRLCPRLGTINSSDAFSSGLLTYNFDVESYPSAAFNSDNGTETINRVTSGISLNTSIGLGMQTDSFAWVGGTTYTLVAGQGAHVTGGINNLLLGKGATSQHSGCLVVTDDTNTTGGSYFPTADNQAVFWKAGGFGIGTNNTGGIQGPKAGFHYSNFEGTDGKLILSAKGPVTTSNMVAYEFNPSIATDTLSIFYKGATNTLNTISFPNTGGTVATLGANNSFTGTNSFSGLINSPFLLETTNALVAGNGAAPNITLATTQDVIAIGNLAGQALPNAPANPSRSLFIGNLCGVAYTTSGGADDEHVGLGYAALRNLTTGFENTGIGAEALLNVTTTGFNTAIGNAAGASLRTGTGQNTIIGAGAGETGATATYSNSVLAGYTAATNLTSSDSSVVIGANAAPTLTSGSNNTILGASADVSAAGASNRIAIGKGTIASNDNEAVIGNSSNTSIVSQNSSTKLGNATNPYLNLYSQNITNVGYDGVFGYAGASTFSGNTINLAAQDVANGILLFNNATTAQTVNFPTAAAFDSLVAGAVTGLTIPVNTSFWLSISNLSSTAMITLVANTNFTLAGLSSVTIPPLGGAIVRISKTVSTPAYVVYGYSGGAGKTLSRNYIVITSTSTYTPTFGLVSADFETIGAGGGGGGATAAASNSAAASGGGGGGYSKGTFTAATIGASQSVTIGAAGTAGIAANGTGGTGGTTSIGSLIQATGGVGGSSAGQTVAQTVEVGGIGGIGSLGTLNVAGGSGSPGLVLIGATPYVFISGNGGNSVYGGGAIGNSPGATGATGGVYGSGGAGATSFNGDGGHAGGPGAPGVVCITEYILT